MFSPCHIHRQSDDRVLTAGQLSKLGDRGIDMMRGTGADRHRRPLAHIGLGNGATEALSGSGDNRDSAGKKAAHDAMAPTMK